MRERHGNQDGNCEGQGRRNGERVSGEKERRLRRLSSQHDHIISGRYGMVSCSMEQHVALHSEE
jgi:hypothetical protein